MRVYFLAEKTSALFLNGIYLGMIDLFERATEMEPADRIWAEVCPAGGFLPVRFYFDEDFLLRPPEQVRLYFDRDKLVVRVGGFCRSDCSLRVLSQGRQEDTLYTLCLQGKLQLNTENERGYHITDLPDALEQSSVKGFQGCLLLQSDCAFALVDRDGTLLLSSEGRVLEAEETLKAEIPFHDCMGHTAVCEWELPFRLAACSVRSARQPTAATMALALFESALIGADCTPFLHPSLKENEGDLRGFLGNFLSVVLTDKTDEVGLVFPVRERVFSVRRFRVETEEGLVSNILPA